MWWPWPCWAPHLDFSSVHTDLPLGPPRARLFVSWLRQARGSQESGGHRVGRARGPRGCGSQRWPCRPGLSFQTPLSPIVRVLLSTLMAPASLVGMSVVGRRGLGARMGWLCMAIGTVQAFGLGVAGEGPAAQLLLPEGGALGARCVPQQP